MARAAPGASSRGYDDLQMLTSHQSDGPEGTSMGRTISTCPHFERCVMQGAHFQTRAGLLEVTQGTGASDKTEEDRPG